MVSVVGESPRDRVRFPVSAKAPERPPGKETAPCSLQGAVSFLKKERCVTFIKQLEYINRIFNMDCLEGIKQLPDQSIDLVCTDPPYFQGLTHNGQRGNFIDLSISKPFFSELSKEMKRVLKPTGEFYFFTDWRGYAFYYPILSTFLPVRNMIVWDKISGAGSFYAYCHELIIYGCMNPNVRKKGRNIWSIKAFCSGAKKTDGEKAHPTQKPGEIIEKIILEGSPGGGTVLDMFAGSGTTGIACKKLNRQYILFELDEEMYQIAVARIEKCN